MFGNQHSINKHLFACVALVAVLAVSACDRDDRPTIAVALGDSFISGEGAQAFITGDGAAMYDGVVPSPLFTVGGGTDPYFCHVSGNSSILVATLPGIDEAANLACSGADPEDLLRANPDHTTVSGSFATNLVGPQLDDYWNLISEKKVELVLVSMGANNSINNFSGVLGFCHAVFMADAAGGPAGDVAEETVIDLYNGGPASVFPSVEAAMDRNGCTATDFYTQAQLNMVKDAYEEGLAQLIGGMALIGYDPASWKLVVQGYASLFDPTPHADFLQANGKTDSADQYVALARERYAAGCPIHVGSMAVSDDLANSLSTIAIDAVASLRNRFPNQDIVYLDVQRAFDGGRLCENAESPAGALWNPLWFRDTGNMIAREIPSPFGGTLAGQWSALAQACANAVTGIFARCQDAAHPNANGHAALSRCLSLAAAHSNAPGNSSDVECRRDPSDGSMSVNNL